jgi:hypothetical protein
MTAEMAMLDAVFLAESVDHANWSTFSELVSRLPEGSALRSMCGDAVAEVEEEEDEHLVWARDTKRKLTMLQARNTMMAKVGEKAEEVMARIKGWFSE